MAPKPICARSNVAKINFSNSGGCSRPARSDKDMQSPTKNTVPRNDHRKTNLKVGLIEGRCARGVADRSVRTPRPSSDINTINLYGQELEVFPTLYFVFA